MQDNHHDNSSATDPEDNPSLADKATPHSGQAYPNKENNPGGGGNPYGGTQSPDPKAPDGNQQPAPKKEGGSTEASPKKTGKEYDSDSSYGHEGAAEDGAGAGTP